MYILIGACCITLFLLVRNFVLKRPMFTVTDWRNGLLVSTVFWLITLGTLSPFIEHKITLFQTVDLFMGLCLLSVPVVLLVVEFFANARKKRSQAK